YSDLHSFPTRRSSDLRLGEFLDVEGSLEFSACVRLVVRCSARGSRRQSGPQETALVVDGIGCGVAVDQKHLDPRHDMEREAKNRSEEHTSELQSLRHL